ncbi:SRPBCC family protein [Streptomyces sp. NPDC016566]|uniref:SRPBCC family protein n=1 Tax=Streptomyces sp. NPDC016566 TaxID=3364967 RepID=UPI0036FBBCCB
MTTHGTTSHSVTVGRTAASVYALLADPTEPVRSSPTVVHIACLERTATGDLVQRWVADGDAVRTWTARRELDPAAGTVAFEHLGPPPPVTSLRGEWRVRTVGPQECLVELWHSWEAADDDGAFAARMERGIPMQLAALKRTAEQGAEAAARTVRQEDTLFLDAPVSEVRAFLRDAGAWPRRVPGCRTAESVHTGPEHQIVLYGTGAAPAARRAFVHLPDRTAWKQLGELPPLHTSLHGTFALETDGTGTRVTAVRTAVLGPVEASGTAWGREELTTHVNKARDEADPALLDGLARAFGPARGAPSASPRSEGA